MFLSTVRQTPGQEGTIKMEKRKPAQMTPEATTYYKHQYAHVDHVVDALDLMVLQNDHQEPVLECLVQIEGNTTEADLQAHVGQVVPNWSEDRQKVALGGEPEVNSIGEPIQMELGDPKSQTIKYKAVERIQYINMLTSLQTDDSGDLARRVRLIRQAQRAERQKLWQKRKLQIEKDLVEEHDVANQLAMEKEAFDNPLQIRRENGTWGGPLFRRIMPPEFTRRIAEDEKEVDWRIRNRANKEKIDVQQVFLDLERTMMHVNLPTIEGTVYHTGLDSMVLEQDETPGQVNWLMANHVRILNVLQQLKPFGTYSTEEEYQIDMEEQNYLVVTEPGQPQNLNDDYRLHQNHLRIV